MAVPTISTASVFSIEPIRAKGGGNCTSDGGKSVSAKGILWSKTNSTPTVSDNEGATNAGGGTGSFTNQNIQPQTSPCGVPLPFPHDSCYLVPNTTYYVRAYANNADGTGYGSVVSFKTTTSYPLIFGDNSYYQTPKDGNIYYNLTRISFSTKWYMEHRQGSVPTQAGFYWCATDDAAFATFWSDGASYLSTYPARKSLKTITSSVYYYNLAATGLTAGKTYMIRPISYSDKGTNYYNLNDWGQITTLTTYVPTLTTNAISAIGGNSATSGGDIIDGGGSSITAKGVCWSTSANPTIANSKTNNGTGDADFTSNITGLTTGTLYYVRAYATNSTGTAYGNQQSFTTLAAPTVTTTIGTAITTRTFTSGGNVTAQGYDAVTARGVCWSTGSTPTIANSKTVNGTGTGAFTSSITGLTPNTLYYYRAYATNSAGTGYGTIRSLTTNVANYCPTNYSATTVDEYSVRFTWTLPEPLTDIYTNFDDYYESGITAYLVSQLHSPNIPTTGYTLTGCTPDFVYTYYFNAVNTTDIPSGNCYTTATEQVSTASLGTTITDFDYLSGTTGTTTFSWTNNNYGDTSKLYYWFYIQKYSGGTWVSITTENFTGYTQCVLKSSLVANTTITNDERYRVALRLFGKGNNFAPFSKYYTSNEFIAPTITTANIYNIAFDSAVGGGEILSGTTCTITNRGVCWSTNINPTTGDTYTLDGSGVGSFTSNLTGLTSGTTYYVRAYATTDFGIFYGNETNFVTDTVPYSPTGLTYSNSTCYSFDLSWVNVGIHQGDKIVKWFPLSGGSVILQTLPSGTTATTITGLHPDNVYTIAVVNDYGFGYTSASIYAYTLTPTAPTDYTCVLINNCAMYFNWTNGICPEKTIIQNYGSWNTIATLTSGETSYVFTGTPTSNIFRIINEANGVQYIAASFIGEIPLELNNVIVKQSQCGPFDYSNGRLYYDMDYFISGHSYTLTIYDSNGNVFYTQSGITENEFLYDNAPEGCYTATIHDDTCDCLVEIFTPYCVTSLPRFSQGGIKKLYLAAWTNDLDYNFWNTADDDYFLEFADTSFFNSTKIKNYLSLSGGTIQWYRLPVAEKVVNLSQKLEKVKQGYIFTDNLTVAVAAGNATKWTQMATLINPENKWIYIMQDADGFWWTGGYRHGARITAYDFKTGLRGEDNGYGLTITAVSENKLLTNIDEAYVINYVE